MLCSRNINRIVASDGGAQKTRHVERVHGITLAAPGSALKIDSPLWL